MTDEQQPRPGAEPTTPGERLESWKEIAAYLRRDVRTVQRWEQTDGLPIHRHKRAQRPIPYAYKAELDAWWTGRPVADVAPPSSPSPTPPIGPRLLTTRAVAVLVAVAIVCIGTLWATRSRLAGNRLTATATPAVSLPKSVAVLPFVDLTEGMRHEEFADGMTEEIINRLHAVAGFNVSPPTSTNYFKNKKVSVAEIAQSLHVAYVVDGSVRRSGDTVRVAVRLIEAAKADVLWSETYDRPWDAALVVQDDIGGAVTKALTDRLSR